jgi:hypothetical protein
MDCGLQGAGAIGADRQWPVCYLRGFTCRDESPAHVPGERRHSVGQAEDGRVE